MDTPHAMQMRMCFLYKLASFNLFPLMRYRSMFLCIQP